MLHLRKLSQTSVDSFTVFDDSHLDNSNVSMKREVEKHSVEIQTDLQFSDVQLSTNLAIPVEKKEDASEDRTSTTNEKDFWMSAATMKAADLDQVRHKNDLVEEKCRENRKIRDGVQEEYDQLYQKLEVLLEGGAEEDQTEETNQP